jgi:hypothetical protein
MLAGAAIALAAKRETMKSTARREWIMMII